MPVQKYIHETTEAESLAWTQPVVDAIQKQWVVKIVQDIDQNKIDKTVKIGKVKPTIFESRDDLRVPVGGAVASEKNPGQPKIDETETDLTKVKELNLATKYNLKEAYDRRTKKDLEESKEPVPVESNGDVHINQTEVPKLFDGAKYKINWNGLPIGKSGKPLKTDSNGLYRIKDSKSGAKLRLSLEQIKSEYSYLFV